MSSRTDYTTLSPTLTRKFLEFTRALKETSLDEALRELVNIRVSQINGCVSCVDLHVKLARRAGVGELTLHHLPVWRESPRFSPRERVALDWAETLTRLPEGGVSNAQYDAARAEMTEAELSDLTFAVIAINGWNRANIAVRAVPGALDAAYGLTGALED